MIIQNVDHIPDFAALIVDRRAGQTDHTLTAFGQKAGGAVLFAASAAKLLRLVKHGRAEAQVGQHVLPAAQQQIMHDINIRLGQGVGRQPAQHMHARCSTFNANKARDFRLPVAHQVRRHHQDGRKRLRIAQAAQRLQRFAKAHFIGQQSAGRGAQPGKPGLLEGHQRANKAARARLHLRWRVLYALPRGGIIPRAADSLFPALPIARGDLQRIAQHQPVQITHNAAVIGKTCLAALTAIRARKQALAQFNHAGLATHRPAFATIIIGKRTVIMPGRRRIL